MKDKFRAQFGQTKRQAMIAMCVAKLAVLRNGNYHIPHSGQPNAGDAIESVLDGVRPGTYGGALRDYWLSLEIDQQARLETAIEKEVRS